MSAEIAALEAEVKEYKLQLETVQLGLQADPENAELQSLKLELEEVITLTESTIAELKPPSAPAPSRHAPPPVASPTPSATANAVPAAKEKWSKENHPAYQAGYRKPVDLETPAIEEAAQQTPTTFAVNDNVLARWKSGDGAFYNARITSITGSSSKPVYIVTFKSYATTETLSAKDIKPLPTDSRKRKADGTPAGMSASPATTAPQSPLPPSNPSVISAAANVDPTLASQARREPSKVSDGPARPAKVPRKVKANKELEAGKSKWQDFTTKGKMGKGLKKDSMFRTPEGVNARVGFTGSGQSMRKDPTRSRHIYQQGGEEEGV